MSQKSSVLSNRQVGPIGADGGQGAPVLPFMLTIALCQS
jgi:hypothetical protein